MADIWVVNLTQQDKARVAALAERRRALELESTFAATLRAAVELALTASDDDLRQGNL